MACPVQGGDKILKEMLRDWKIEAGDTTEDRCFTVASVYCTGCCILTPAVTIDDEVHAKLTPKKTRALLNRRCVTGSVGWTGDAPFLRSC